MIGYEPYGTLNGVEYDKRHGGPYDRGAADSYYSRGVEPHYFVEATGRSERVEVLTKEELEAYMAGYDWNEKYGDKKRWD